MESELQAVQSLDNPMMGVPSPLVPVQSSPNMFIPVGTGYPSTILSRMVPANQSTQPVNDYMYPVDYNYMWTPVSQTYPWRMPMNMGQQYSVYQQYMPAQQPSYSMYQMNNGKQENT